MSKVIGIIGALDNEVDAIKNSLNNLKVDKFSNMDFYHGSIGDNEVVVTKCGMGKVLAAMHAEAMVIKYSPDEIIHIGIAGALTSDLGLKDVAIASDVIQHDLDCTAIGEPAGYVPEYKVDKIPCAKRIVDKLEEIASRLNIKYKVGTIASGDQFISGDAEKDKIVKNFGAIAAEMEGASTGLVCYVNGIDFAVVRAMSDSGDDDSGDIYYKTKQVASDVATKIVLEYLK